MKAARGFLSVAYGQQQMVDASTPVAAQTPALLYLTTPIMPVLCLPVQEYITLPPAFYLELDLEQQVLVERSSSNPYALLTSGIHQLELQTLIQVSWRASRSHFFLLSPPLFCTCSRSCSSSSNKQ